MENNIPAFPRAYSESKRGYGEQFFEAQDGMTLRDYFAGQCVMGLLASKELYSKSDDAKKDISIMSYAIADALLKARDDHD